MKVTIKSKTTSNEKIRSFEVAWPATLKERTLKNLNLFLNLLVNITLLIVNIFKMFK